MPVLSKPDGAGMFFCLYSPVPEQTLICTQKSRTQRNDMNPHAGKKFPPETARPNPLSLALYLRDQRKNLLAAHRAFDLCLCIADDVIALPPNAADAVHDILSCGALVKHHIARTQRTVRCPEADAVPPMHEKRSHAVARNHHADLSALFDQTAQHGDIFCCIDNLHGRLSLLVFDFPMIAQNAGTNNAVRRILRRTAHNMT